MGITVAGTAQDSHLIPFSCTGETPVHHHFGCKVTHYFIYMQFFLEKIAYSPKSGATSIAVPLPIHLSYGQKNTCDSRDKSPRIQKTATRFSRMMQRINNLNLLILTYWMLYFSVWKSLKSNPCNWRISLSLPILLLLSFRHLRISKMGSFPLFTNSTLGSASWVITTQSAVTAGLGYL